MRKFKGDFFFTIIKDKFNHPYYKSLIGQAYRLIRIVERYPGQVTLRRTNNRKFYSWGKIKRGKKQLYFVLDARRHCYEPNAPMLGQNCMWELEEIRESTEKEIREYHKKKLAEKI